MKYELRSFKNVIRTMFLGSCMLGVVFTMSCDNGDDEPEPELYDLSGLYIFNEAVLTDGKVEIATALGNPQLAALIPDDITDEMAGGLLAEAPCDNPANGAVELKSNLELFFACLGETNEAKSGTWSVNNDTTELNLNLAVSSGNLQLKISNLVINELTDVIGGSIVNFPITKSLLAGFLVALVPDETTRNGILQGIADDITILVDVDIEFKKVEP